MANGRCAMCGAKLQGREKMNCAGCMEKLKQYMAEKREREQTARQARAELAKQIRKKDEELRAEQEDPCVRCAFGRYLGDGVIVCMSAPGTCLRLEVTSYYKRGKKNGRTLAERVFAETQDLKKANAGA